MCMPLLGLFRLCSCFPFNFPVLSIGFDFLGLLDLLNWVGLLLLWWEVVGVERKDVILGWVLSCVESCSLEGLVRLLVDCRESFVLCVCRCLVCLGCAVVRADERICLGVEWDVVGSCNKDETELLWSSLPANNVTVGLDRVGICDWSWFGTEV